MQVNGNPEVIELLEAYLEVAKTQHFAHVAITLVKHPNIGAADFAGDISLEQSSLEAMGRLAGRLKASIDNWTLPPRDENLGADHVVYNVANGPLGFDFIIWLIDAEMTRRRENAPWPLKVAFFVGRNGQVTPERHHWIENVFRPALGFIGALESISALHGHHKELYLPRDIIAASRSGEPVPTLVSKEPSSRYSPVTITLREASHWSHRNSNLEAWLTFATWLRDQGETVVFVRDTEYASEPVPQGFRINERAACDLRARLALYESAKANLFVSNGPAVLAQFGSKPWLMFVPLEEEGSVYTPNTPAFWRNMMGLAPGDQYPWSGPGQRMVWASDNYEEIMKAWREHISPVVGSSCSSECG